MAENKAYPSGVPAAIPMPSSGAQPTQTPEEPLLLAFSHFDECNQAHLTMDEYERCLMNMWRELCRVYAGRPISLPLLGSGITRFDDVRRKSEGELLRCMLCTLRSTGHSFSKPISIVLTSEAISRVDLYEMKGVLRYGL